MKRKPPTAQDAGRADEVDSTESRVIRMFVLVVLTVQNCSLMMVTSYSRSLPGPKYLTSTAVLAGEVVKTAVVLSVLAYQHGVCGLQAVVSQDVFSGGSQTARYAIPSVFYTLQNNLWYYSMSNLDPVTAAVTSQLKVISTAVFSMLILTKQLTHLHWSALGLLMLGLVIMEVGPEAEDLGGGNYYLGLLSMVVACTSSGYAGVYLELLFKQLNANVWTANLQLQLFCLPIAALALLSDLPGLWDGGPFYGWNGITCVVVLLNALGGFVVSLTMKYADNILKTFAVSMSLVVNCIMSWLFMSVTLTRQAITGVTLVIAATFLYSTANSVGSSKATGASRTDYAHVKQDSEKELDSVAIGACDDARSCEDPKPSSPKGAMQAVG
mmetsp:Transcript_97629/g.304509  ORF Transcript_97629/g.304509 Transcript_97629/m.304509 type:complete len:383 (+) Transcript_97629:127-1275(+)